MLLSQDNHDCQNPDISAFSEWGSGFVHRVAELALVGRRVRYLNVVFVVVYVGRYVRVKPTVEMKHVLSNGIM